MAYEVTFRSKRPDLVTRNGMVACAQPLAAQAGLGVILIDEYAGSFFSF